MSNNLLIQKVFLKLMTSFIKTGQYKPDQLKILMGSVFSQVEAFYNQLELNNQNSHYNKDYFTCLLCNKNIIFLNQHLKTHHNSDIKDYCQQFNLPNNYPQIPENYSNKRRKIAKNMNLGSKTKDKNIVNKFL